MFHRILRRLQLLFAAIVFCPAVSAAQFSIQDLQPGPSFGSPPQQELTLFAAFKVVEGQSVGELSVAAQIAPDWHVYSVTQKGTPGPAELTIDPAAPVRLLGPFVPDQPPVVRPPDIFPNPVEEHYDSVTWTAPIQIDPGTNLPELTFQVIFDGQVCNDKVGCIPISDKKVTAKFAGYTSPLTVIQPFRDDGANVSWLGYVEPQIAAPGDTVTLVLAAAPDPEWHLYARQDIDPNALSKPTLITFRERPDWFVSEPLLSTLPISKSLAAGDAPSQYYERPVSWTYEFQVPAAATPGSYSLAGLVGYQTCTQNSCTPPEGAEFKVPVVVGTHADGRRPVSFTPSSYRAAAQLAEETHVAPQEQPVDFWATVFMTFGFQEGKDGWFRKSNPEVIYQENQLITRCMALLVVFSITGGMILNVMPCVLPVLGLKLMSFLNQAGESRWRVFSLNLWYSAGILAVFLAIATIAAVLHTVGATLSWGEHMGDPRFTIPLLSIVFVLGLSMFGVWEIPIPGFAGGSEANKLSEREGPAGAFFKGVLTTILATPCSGPYIGVAIGLAVIAPIWMNYLLFALMALGMALPFLIVGAFPSLIRVLPKPGNWMVTFKQFMGFILMATAVWIVSLLEPRFVVPVLGMLVCFSISCWVFGKISITANLRQRARGWVLAAIFGIAGVITLAGFLPPPSAQSDVAVRESNNPSELPWQAFTPERLEKHRAAGATVLVDFTADWCLTCKTNEAVALNTQETKELVLKNNVVTLKADKTHKNRSQPVNDLLVQLGNRGKTIPFVAVYPAGVAEPVTLSGLITKDEILRTLEKAGPSRIASRASLAERQ